MPVEASQEAPDFTLKLAQLSWSVVRFSDLLGGGGEPEDGRATSAPLDREPDPEDEVDVEPETDVEQETDAEPEPVSESPQDVLDRLTQYATSARAADQVTPPPSPSPPRPAATSPASEVDEETNIDSLAPVADDILPRSPGGAGKPRRSRKRRP